ncbi:MAG: ATP-binding protein [Candidatus Eremiobacteraeota bacterium]|nr:ATP-binding protein [Candidatus Eremiobacteraeota bacterium]MBV8371762.1 ATP-binding protein [Candidatus Eremiobacteraeota bacterium]
MRHALAAFLAALNVPERVALDVVTAVGEALANSVEHAYRDCPVGEVKILARLENGGILVVEVVDRGTFAAPKRRPNRGFGLRIVRSVAQNVRLETACGTSIRMRFNLGSS